MRKLTLLLRFPIGMPCRAFVDDKTVLGNSLNRPKRVPKPHRRLSRRSGLGCG